MRILEDTYIPVILRNHRVDVRDFFATFQQNLSLKAQHPQSMGMRKTKVCFVYTIHFSFAIVWVYSVILKCQQFNVKCCSTKDVNNEFMASYL